MTISGTETSIVVNGNDLTTVFSYDFYMGGSSAYAVLVHTDADGVSTTIDAADFTITGVTSQSGGTFTYPLTGSPIATGETLTLSRVLPIVQSAAIGNQGNFYPSVVEGALDYQTMVMQQLAEGSGQTIDAASLFGNSSDSSAAGSSIPIGSGLSFSGNTLIVSGISGSGTVTEVNTGTGLSGGPITGVGTITMATITTGMVLGNFSGATAAPQGVTVTAGSGITLSNTTTSLTISLSGGSSGLVFITSSTGVGAATITFSSITSAYTHLVIVFSGRSTGGASPAANVLMTFNGDGGTNYDQVTAQLANGTYSNATAAGATSIRAGLITWSSSTTSNVGGGDIQIQNYKNTSLFKGSKHSGGTIGATTAGASFLWADGFGIWRSTASITRVDLTLSAGNWDTGSIASLYGIS